MPPSWHIRSFRELTLEDLYDLIRLRVDIFVVEQACPYHELDGKDCHEKTRHVWARSGDGRMAACARVLAPGVSFSGASIGRVAVHPEFRGQGLARALLLQCLETVAAAWPGIPVCIGAQTYLESFYRSFGFVRCSETYLEDGILHVDMVLNRS